MKKEDILQKCQKEKNQELETFIDDYESHFYMKILFIITAIMIILSFYSPYQKPIILTLFTTYGLTYFFACYYYLKTKLPVFI